MHKFSKENQNYKLAITVHGCLHNKAPKYLAAAVLLFLTSPVVSDWAQHIFAS